MNAQVRPTVIAPGEYDLVENKSPLRDFVFDRLVRNEHALVRLSRASMEESAWIKLTGYDPQRLNFVGYLANDTVRIGARHGQRVEFQRQHVFRVISKHKE